MDLGLKLKPVDNTTYIFVFSAGFLNFAKNKLIPFFG